MKKEFSKDWKASKRPAKQRKYRFNAPLHIKSKFLSAHLSKELRKKYARRSMTIVKGDKVKVMRGQYRGRENKVDHVDHNKLQVFITGIDTTRKDGSKSLIPLQPSNLMLTELNLDDKRRKASLERKKTEEK
jgi:large subunit ribosomal protein L24